MATMTLNIAAKELNAVSDIYSTEDNVTPIVLEVLENDILGVEPTTITSIDTTGFTLGTVVINVDNETLDFTPNGNYGTSRFTYTITDSTTRTSTGVVTLTIIEPE
jgi:hypothetical protein